MTIGSLRLGTRASTLARVQSQQVAAALAKHLDLRVETVEIATRGDHNDEPLAQIGGTGVFVSALREALLRHEIDAAVHSLKDLPTLPAEGLWIGAVPEREDPRDVLVARGGLTLAELPTGAVVGTGSPRRAAQLRAVRADLEVTDIRGNVDTRLRRVAEGAYDAVVLARAGLARLDRLDAVTEVFDPLQVTPAPGQGALGVECRADDAATRSVLQPLDHPDSRAAVTAERALLSALEAGCTAPVGALADVADDIDGPELYLRAVVVSVDGSRAVRMSTTGDVGDADSLGRRLAESMLADGAAGLMGVGVR
ncbi:MAG: hydroxymethylbilane synthase [Candidatus Nanopelagicales bacterium]